MEGRLYHIENQLDENVASDHKTLGMLTRDLQEFVQKAQEAFQEVATKFSTISKLRESADLVMGLEFALARMEMRLAHSFAIWGAG
jgi:flagellin-specific chaperone FliS